jgi:type VI secretion system secreted protein VgrG
MAETPTQDGRIGKLATPLGKDKLCLIRFEGTEAIGELFEYRIEAVSTDANIDFHHALGRICSVHLETTDRVGRDFSGMLTEAKWVGTRFNLHLYRLVLRPWLWFLTLRAHCRIFSNMNVKDIIKQVVDSDAVEQKKIVDLTVEDYPTLEYTVQYRETSLNFISRLMEKFGIYYYFKFDEGDGDSPSLHSLVLADSSNHELLPAPRSILYVPPSVAAPDETQLFNDWSRQQNVIPGIFQLNDYDYNKPNARLSTHEAHFTPPSNTLIWDYPGGYDDKALGDRLTKVRMEAERPFEDHCAAGGYAPSLTPGYSIKRTSQNGDPQDGDYLVLRCNHRYGDQSYVSTSAGGSSGGASYSASYSLLRVAIPYRMPLRTSRPVIVGSQPAKVISKENQEIDVDKQGRVVVEFYWDDLTGSNMPNKTPSRRVRVGQFWAGLQRGALFIPRVGDEVMVEYENGDPDRPIIVGSVYNGTSENPGNLVPATLPATKTVSGLLGKSSTDGGSTIHNANSWWFDDAKGSEQFYLRARKDLFFRAYNNQNIRIGANVTETVGGDEKINVGPVDEAAAQVAESNQGGNFTLNAFQSITLNVGPSNLPLTQIKMDQESITLSVGPNGILAQIRMDETGVTISGTPISQVMVQPGGITTATPNVTVGFGPVTFASPSVTIPIATIGVANIGAGTVGGVMPLT